MGLLPVLFLAIAAAAEPASPPARTNANIVTTTARARIVSGVRLSMAGSTREGGALPAAPRIVRDPATRSLLRVVDFQ